jgi:hypothetical protein
LDRQQRLEAQDRAEIDRAARSFGSRPLDRGQAPAVDRDSRLRQGLLPLAPTRNRSPGGNSLMNKFRLGRLLQRGLAWIQQAFGRDPNAKGSTSLTVDGLYRDTLVRGNGAQPINNGMGSPFPQPPDRKVVVAGDRDLVKGLQQSHAYAIPDPDPGRGLFAGGAPRLSDIRQSDSRQTCYLLSHVAGTLAKPDGADRIQRMMHDHGDGTVTVRFRDKDVRVTKDRVVDAHGNDVFNRGAPWVRTLEKAYLAYHMAKMGGDDDIGKTAASYKGGDAMLEDTFDRGSPLQAADALAPLHAEDPNEIGSLDENHQAASGPRYGQDHEFLSFSEPKSPDADRAVLDKIDDTLENGGTVAAGVSGAGKWFKRVLPNHVYSVLGTGTRTDTKTGQQVQGYWVFDPYGSSVSEMKDHQAPESPSDPVTLPNAWRGRDARFFVPKDQFRDLFGNVQIFKLKSEAPQANQDPPPVGIEEAAESENQRGHVIEEEPRHRVDSVDDTGD